jgi:hypothetical protein
MRHTYDAIHWGRLQRSCVSAIYYLFTTASLPLPLYHYTAFLKPMFPIKIARCLDKGYYPQQDSVSNKGCL